MNYLRNRHHCFETESAIRRLEYGQVLVHVIGELLVPALDLCWTRQWLAFDLPRVIPALERLTAVDTIAYRWGHSRGQLNRGRCQSGTSDDNNTFAGDTRVFALIGLNFIVFWGSFTLRYGYSSSSFMRNADIDLRGT